MSTETIVKCPKCGRDYEHRDYLTECHTCRQHEKMVRQGLKWCRVTPLPSALFWKPWSLLAVIGETLELSHSGRGYWVVKGGVPLTIARALYADPVGRDVIRVAGHCSCPEPDEWATWRDPATGKELATKKSEAEFDRYIAATKGDVAEHMREGKAKYIFVDVPSAHGVGTVDLYHIDGDLGLRVFVDTLVRHGFHALVTPTQEEARDAR